MKWRLWPMVFFLIGCAESKLETQHQALVDALEDDGFAVSYQTPENLAGLPNALNYIQLTPPSHLADTLPVSSRNPLSLEGISLGKKLFFDPTLSGNNKLSCASCHHPDKFFSDGIALTQRGASGKKLRRHAPALINLAWHPTLFWDGGAHDLASLTFAPLTHPDEMAQDLKELVAELKQHSEYPVLFQQVFRDSIQSAYVARALAQYQRTFLSANSPYDKWIQGDSSALTKHQLEGLTLFNKNCAACHPPPFFTDFSYHNNGLDSRYPTEWEHEGQGRYRITLHPEDLGKFKTPTLRNVANTQPYMHDGRFTTLEAVLIHYTTGVKPSSTLDSLLLQSNRLGIKLSASEQRAIIAFLKSLSDN